MTQNSNNSSKENEIRLPDKVQKQVEEMEREMGRKAQQDRTDAFAREMERKTPKERQEMEEEIKRLKEANYAPETRTEEELKREDERVIRIFDELKAKRKRE